MNVYYIMFILKIEWLYASWNFKMKNDWMKNQNKFWIFLFCIFKKNSLRQYIFCMHIYENGTDWYDLCINCGKLFIFVISLFHCLLRIYIIFGSKSMNTTRWHMTSVQFIQMFSIQYYIGRINIPLNRLFISQKLKKTFFRFWYFGFFVFWNAI